MNELNNLNPIGLLLFLVSIVGLVAAVLLRHRDGRASLLLTAGFGVNLLGSVLSFFFGIFHTFIDASLNLGNTNDLNTALTITHSASLVSRLISVVALVLVFWGLFRLARHRTTADAGVAR